MKNFEKALKTIQNNNKDFLLDSDVNIPKDILRFLKAKDLIELRSHSDNKLRIVLTSYGITYFEDKKETRKAVILNWSFNFAMAVLSAICGSAFTLFVQYVLMK